MISFVKSQEKLPGAPKADVAARIRGSIVQNQREDTSTRSIIPTAAA